MTRLAVQLGTPCSLMHVAESGSRISKDCHLVPTNPQHIDCQISCSNLWAQSGVASPSDETQMCFPKMQKEQVRR